MPYTELIKDTLDILDLNIEFNEINPLKKEKIKGTICMVYSGSLNYKAKECPHCCQQDETKIIKWGATECMILMNDVSEYKTWLRLKKRRFFCKECCRTFVADTSVVEKNCVISKKVKLSIAERLTKKTAMSEIAQQKKVSVSSVYRVLKKFHSPVKPYTQPLPNVLCIDEFKSVKNVEGSMSFIMMNGQTKELIDIVENRQLRRLRDYFHRFPLETRKKVAYVVMDMYTPYMTLVNELFPEAKIIIDRFHIVKRIGDAFQKHRISCMNALNKKNHDQKRQAKLLKKYWKLLQKSALKLDYEHPKWQKTFRAYLTESEIVDRLLNFSDELKRGYHLYQEFLYVIHERDVKGFNQLLSEDYTNYPEGYQTAVATFTKYQNEINHALMLPYSNGPLEGLNNHIKVLKRNAYGFRNFNNFKLRIQLCFGQVIFNSKKS